MTEQFLTVEQAASLLKVHPITIRRHLRSGTLRGMKSGKLWRVAESALTVPLARTDTVTPQGEADSIWNDMTGGDDRKRSAAIKTLAFASEAVSQIVLARSAAVAAVYYASPEGQEEWEELAEWRALDSEPYSEGKDKSA